MPVRMVMVGSSVRGIMARDLIPRMTASAARITVMVG